MFDPLKIFKKPEAARRETQKEMSELKKLAQEMVNDPRYIKYREQLENVLGKLVKDLINYNHPDNNVYAVNMRIITQQIKDLLAILDTPITFLNYVAMSEYKFEEKKESPYGAKI